MEDAPLLVVAVGSQADALDDVVVPKNAKCYPFLPQERCWGLMCGLISGERCHFNLSDLTNPSESKSFTPHLEPNTELISKVEILKAKVDLFLTHGGQNSFMESLMAGTPVVVCPGFADQIANAMRAVTWHHVGWKQRGKGGMSQKNQTAKK